MKDITVRTATMSTMQAATEVKNAAMKRAVTKIITASAVAGIVVVVVVVSGSSVTTNYAW